MADPGTVIFTGLALLELAIFIGRSAVAIDDFRKIKPDEELNELYSEVANFRASCEVVGTQLKRIATDEAIKSFLKANDDLFPNTLRERCNEEAQACSRTAEDLEKLINHMARQRSGWGKLEKVAKSASLLWRNQDAEKLRDRIRTHLDFLKMVLGTANMYYCTFPKKVEIHETDASQYRRPCHTSRNERRDRARNR